MRVRLVAARVTAPPSRRRQSSRSRDDRDGRDGAGPCRAVQAASGSDSAPDGAASAPVTRTLRPAARRHSRAAPARAMIRCLMRRIRSRSGPARAWLSESLRSPRLRGPGAWRTPPGRPARAAYPPNSRAGSKKTAQAAPGSSAGPRGPNGPGRSGCLATWHRSRIRML